MKPTEHPFEQTYSIRSYEPRTDGRVSIASICNYMQDIASVHADSLGFGYEALQQSGHFWILARLHVMMDRLPGYSEKATLKTWPSANERLVAMRDFLINDQEKRIGHATSSWVAMNLETHRPDRPEEVLNGRHIPERERALIFPTKAITRLKEANHTTDLKARRADIDINGHVNNVRYVEFCMEAVPHSWTQSNRCMGIDIQFRTESFAGDEYSAGCTESEQDNGMDTFLHSLTRVSDNKEIVRMRSWWKRS
ncbi:acyl-[acyl-carrier-protein] thioesterase [Pseudodesulfovibrio sediminis]|uniref:Acyl-ACP thioesterase n=1 Tax=Pseudodesulfovibrio sediminis TaxID=2810563 RepID=A0ABM8I2S7_9BACT|nr:acyl-ACP thioesterase domain-containing protein [Pseudodesulfovibrio sediminis]BCS88190.1 acyl-ACP thioesterase [Pseudodesulfovibrio sediminis]